MNKDANMHEPTLPTYDPGWAERWARSDRLLKAMQARGEYDAEYQVYLAGLHRAYEAQFRTVREVWDHDLKHALFRGKRVNAPVPELPADATLEEAKALIERFRQDVQDAEYASERPVSCDPAELVAFSTPARRGCRRSIVPLTLDGSGDRPPVRCLVVTETVADEAHVCFVWQRDGGSLCDEIERLATHVYCDKLAPALSRGWLRCWRPGRGYEPGQVFFHEYDPWHVKSGLARLHDEFSSVQLTWHDGRGFVGPVWKKLGSVPLFRRIRGCV